MLALILLFIFPNSHHCRQILSWMVWTSIAVLLLLWMNDNDETSLDIPSEFADTTVDEHSFISFKKILFINYLILWMIVLGRKHFVWIILSEICPFLSILSAKFLVIIHYMASTDSTLAFNPHKNLSFCLDFFLFTQTSYLLVQDVSFPVVVAVMFFFSTFNRPSNGNLLVKTTQKYLARAGSFVTTILLSLSWEYKYLFPLFAGDSLPAFHWVLCSDCIF